MPYIVNIQLAIDIPGAPATPTIVGEPCRLHLKFATKSEVAAHSWSAHDTTVMNPPPDNVPQRQRHKVIFTYDDLVELGIEYSRAHLVRLSDSGLFPKRVFLSKRRFGWRKSEVQEWVANRNALPPA